MTVPVPNDVIRIWFLRHATRQKRKGDSICALEAPLSEQGRAEAEEIRQRLADEKFDILRHSPVKRAEETAKLVVPGGLWEPEPCLGVSLSTVWEWFLPRKDSIPEWSKIEEELTAVEVGHAADLIRELVRRLRGGQQALVVGHQPAGGLLREIFDPAFPKGEGEKLQPGGSYVLEFSHEGIFRRSYD